MYTKARKLLKPCLPTTQGFSADSLVKFYVLRFVPLPKTTRLIAAKVTTQTFLENKSPTESSSSNGSFYFHYLLVVFIKFVEKKSLVAEDTRFELVA